MNENNMDMSLGFVILMYSCILCFEAPSSYQVLYILRNILISFLKTKPI